ncbi:hypothetical protein ACIBTV_26735 [Micromonospora sp. NPDC049366]|uniref:hypothetical protein n=1 Tax=Micromonospora sp. NPDC049366 TaxID=3364271 RepID=UPI00378D5800
MTAKRVNGLRVVSDRATRSPLRAHNHDSEVYWQQVRHLVLEDHSETYGCQHDDFTDKDRFQVLLHLRTCAAKPSKPAKGKNAGPAQDSLPHRVAQASPKAGSRRPAPAVRFEAPPLPTVRPAQTTVPPAASAPDPTPARPRQNSPAAAPQRPTTAAAPTSPAPAAAPDPLADLSLPDLVDRLLQIPVLEEKLRRTTKQRDDWKQRAQAAEGAINTLKSAITGTKVRKNARTHL